MRYSINKVIRILLSLGVIPCQAIFATVGIPNRVFLVGVPNRAYCRPHLPLFGHLMPASIAIRSSTGPFLILWFLKPVFVGGYPVVDYWNLG